MLDGIRRLVGRLGDRLTFGGTGNPEDVATEERLIAPFLSPSGDATGFVPHPLDSGPPQPEPEERWTLGPR